MYHLPTLISFTNDCLHTYTYYESEKKNDKNSNKITIMDLENKGQFQ